MTNLSLAAQAALTAAINVAESPDAEAIAAAVLRAAANYLTDATSGHTLYAIADELEGITYGTYRCNLEGR